MNKIYSYVNKKQNLLLFSLCTSNSINRIARKSVFELYCDVGCMKKAFFIMIILLEWKRKEKLKAKNLWIKWMKLRRNFFSVCLCLSIFSRLIENVEYRIRFIEFFLKIYIRNRLNLKKGLMFSAIFFFIFQLYKKKNKRT